MDQHVHESIGRLHDGALALAHEITELERIIRVAQRTTTDPMSDVTAQNFIMWCNEKAEQLTSWTQRIAGLRNAMDSSLHREPPPDVKKMLAALRQKQIDDSDHGPAEPWDLEGGE